MNAAPGVTGIVLAGGRATRFGGPKLAVELNGEPLLNHAIRAVRAVADEVIVVGAPMADRESGTGGNNSIRYVPDDEPFAGPLSALAAALRETGTALAIVVGGDMPGLVPGVLVTMLRRLAAAADIDAVLLASPTLEQGRRQVLPLALRVTTGSRAAIEALGAGDRSLVRLLERLRSIEIPAPEWLDQDPGGRTLLDVDRPGDLERIRRKL
ncbi:MAG: molybdenum cofactor guanylyltransferase [Candidatus Limnocylindrales bacterium]